MSTHYLPGFRQGAGHTKLELSLQSQVGKTVNKSVNTWAQYQLQLPSQEEVTLKDKSKLARPASQAKAQRHENFA